MRITSFMLYEQFARYLQTNMKDFAKFNTRLASGKKINSISEDVIGSIKALDYKVNISSNEQCKKNIAEAKTLFDFTNAVLNSAAKMLPDIRNIVLTSVSGSLSAEERAAFAYQTTLFRDNLLALANSKFREKYIFSGFRTDMEAFNNATFDYQGDSGIINVMVDRNTVLPVNIPGSSAFAYTLNISPETIQINNGMSVRYTQGAGTTINVEILDSGGSVIDSFSFSNVIQMTDILSSALSTGNSARIEALLKPFSVITNQILTSQAEIGARANTLTALDKQLANNNLTLNNILSKTEDADMTETIMEINKADTALQALREASKKVLAQSLMDFLR